MENASKALIIAGAILLSILIIALGMNVYNSANSSAANADLSAQEIQSFNSTFEAYEGNQKGTSVRSLITAVTSSNEKNEDRQIIINGTEGDDGYTASEDADTITKQSQIKSNKTYTVQFDYSDESGLIENIRITEGKNSGTDDDE